MSHALATLNGGLRELVIPFFLAKKTLYRRSSTVVGRVNGFVHKYDIVQILISTATLQVALDYNAPMLTLAATHFATVTEDPYFTRLAAVEYDKVSLKKPPMRRGDRRGLTRRAPQQEGDVRDGGQPHRRRAHHPRPVDVVHHPAHPSIGLRTV